MANTATLSYVFIYKNPIDIKQLLSERKAIQKQYSETLQQHANQLPLLYLLERRPRASIHRCFPINAYWGGSCFKVLWCSKTLHICITYGDVDATWYHVKVQSILDGTWMASAL